MVVWVVRLLARQHGIERRLDWRIAWRLRACIMDAAQQTWRPSSWVQRVVVLLVVQRGGLLQRRVRMLMLMVLMEVLLAGADGGVVMGRLGERRRVVLTHLVRMIGRQAGSERVWPVCETVVHRVVRTGVLRLLLRA